MSRIRSIHPGLWTDEDFVSLSAFARLLFIGLWNECDDKGIFEWKPLTLKMRVMPADNADVATLLAEIEAIGAIRKYEVDGKAYGAVRNFCKFQRPKKPNDIHPITPEMRVFVGIGSEPLGNQSGTGGGIAPQMEDGGGREGGKGKESKGAFAFAGEVIRLRRNDFVKWERAFPDLELSAVLQARDDWLKSQPEPERKRWFQSTSNFLANKQQQARGARGEPAFSGPC